MVKSFFESMATLEQAGSHESKMEELQAKRDRINKVRVVLVLTDIKKAYPSVSTSRCWRTWQTIGVSDKMLDVIKQLHEFTYCMIITNVENSERYQFQRGLREGCPSSCIIPSCTMKSFFVR